MKHDLSDKMLAAVRSLGDALENPDGSGTDAGKACNDLMSVYHDAHQMETDFGDCVNELCMKCGNYKYEHKGACNGCRWLMKRGGW